MSHAIATTVNVKVQVVNVLFAQKKPLKPKRSANAKIVIVKFVNVEAIMQVALPITMLRIW
ncbi:MAG: hypothetical protein N2490_02725 [Ignavibacteria bacterium]|nr:hypothetical protein [Ignavibacteria bacterium]